MEITLGFAEKTEAWKLKSKYFPSKIGGSPSWLSPEFLPSGSDLQCEKCKKPLIFLCQIYAPITTEHDCFHRSLFVFICKDGKCSSLNCSVNLQVFRCQLPRVNKFYSAEPPKDEENTLANHDVSSLSRICRVCGCLGLKICGHCRLVSYCSRDHQLMDWKVGHKSECKLKELETVCSKASSQILFPEYEIDLETEELYDEAEPEDKPQEGVKEADGRLLMKGANQSCGFDEFEEGDLSKMAKRETDKEFAKFRARIEHYPDQVLRYQRNGSPLFVSAENKPTDIPNCENCGTPRIFEFQIMPQFLVYLNVDCMDESIDWGTILIYTCAKSCSSKELMYFKEFCFKQDYSCE